MATEDVPLVSKLLFCSPSMLPISEEQWGESVLDPPVKYSCDYTSWILTYVSKVNSFA